MVGAFPAMRFQTPFIEDIHEEFPYDPVLYVLCHGVSIVFYVVYSRIRILVFLLYTMRAIIQYGFEKKSRYVNIRC